MSSALRLQIWKPANSIRKNCKESSSGYLASGSPAIVQLPRRHFACVSLWSDDSLSEPSITSRFTSAVGCSPSSIQLSNWALTQRHILLLNFVACAAAISATWVFCCAIPSIRAFRRTAESLEELWDAKRAELPDNMAAVRLSGMEINDLTSELCDLSQEITQGVRTSTRAVRLAEERLRWLKNMGLSATMQEVVALERKTQAPALARSARSLRDAIIKGRAIFQMFFTLTRFSKMTLNYFSSRAK
ncbi:hypothetical protein NMG60_11017016 [Bertholletia excelsa]